MRHYEDAARIIRAEADLPPLADHAGVAALAADMLARRQIAAIPVAGDPALASAEGGRWDGIRAAQAAIAPLFWGTRIPLDEACARIRAWITDTLR